MKKLFTPILVLTLIVGFSALALGATTKASADQTLTVDVAKAYSISPPSTISTGTVEVGPDTTASETGLSLGYSFNNTNVTSIDVTVSSTQGSELQESGIELTFDVSGTPSGHGQTDALASHSTPSPTLITSPDIGDNSASVGITFSKVDWDYDQSDPINLTATYKIMT